MKIVNVNYTFYCDIPGLTNKDSSGTFPRKPASGTNVEQSTRTGSGAGATSRSSSTKPGIATSSSAAGGRDSSSGNNKSGTAGGASTMAASTKSTSSSSSPPFLLSYLAGVSWSKISEYGMTGWYGGDRIEIDKVEITCNA